MAHDYDRYSGSKEPIGWIESTKDNSKFIVETAKVTITRFYYSNGAKRSAEVIKDAPCTIDNQSEQTSHRISYIWDVKDIGGCECRANFSLHLKGGLVLVRQVSIYVHI